ncbi:hypothetical protein NHJ13051_009911 [Beauveria bassiana]
MAHVPSVGGTVLSPYIQGWGSWTPGVRGSNVAPIGASICRSGSTTGLRCGSVNQFGVTVNYAQGAVVGLIGTNACAEGADSGGSFFSDHQAQAASLAAPPTSSPLTPCYLNTVFGWSLKVKA